MKKFLLSVLALVPFMGFAEAYTTAGNGTTYNLQSLSEIEGSNVTLESEGVYVLNETVTIAQGDNFSLESGVTLKMGDYAELIINGGAQLNCTEVTTITRSSEEAGPYGVFVYPSAAIEPVYVNNVVFDYAGLRFLFDEALDGKGFISNCEFTNNSGRNASGALALGSSSCSFEIKNCRFVSNTVPAIGSAGNYFCGILIDECYFEDNNASNTNKPQVNITSGMDREVIVRNSEFVGAQRTMVGGLAVSNMLTQPGDHKVTIEGNTFRGHRYGVTTTSLMNVIIKNNIIVDNKYETNPMNGGSGISIYDPYNRQNAYIEGNTIEDNLWGITVINSMTDFGVINIGKVEDPTAADYNPGNNKFKNNGNGGVLYDLYNNTPNTIYAQGNTWGVEEQTEEQIETVISHKNDDASLGLVIFMPAGNDSGIDDIEAENAPIEYFNLLGVKVTCPENGVFIKKQGNTATKVVL